MTAPTKQPPSQPAGGCSVVSLGAEVVTVVSDRGGKYGYVVRSRQGVYRALRRHGLPKSMAARISNAGRTRAGRSIMARKAAKTRKRRGGR